MLSKIGTKQKQKRISEPPKSMQNSLHSANSSLSAGGGGGHRSTEGYRQHSNHLTSTSVSIHVKRLTSDNLQRFNRAVIKKQSSKIGLMDMVSAAQKQNKHNNMRRKYNKRTRSEPVLPKFVLPQGWDDDEAIEMDKEERLGSDLSNAADTPRSLPHTPESIPQRKPSKEDEDGGGDSMEAAIDGDDEDNKVKEDDMAVN